MSTNKPADRRLSRSAATIVFCVSSAAAISQGAPVAAEDTGKLEEVIVTATGRRAQSFDVPLALSVTTGDALERANVTSLESISAIDPAVNVRNYGPGLNSFIIRGIVSQAQPTTGVYLDQVPLLGGHQTEGSGDPTPALRLFDIERLEVLKGPQGTLFGAGSMAGTIRAITVQPKLDEFSADVVSSAGAIKGGKELYGGHAIFNVPLTESFGVRAVGWAEDGGAFIDYQPFGEGVLQKNANDTSVWGGRLTALWRASDQFSLTGRVTRQEIDSDNNSGVTDDRYFNSVPTIGQFDDDVAIYDATATLEALAGTITASIARTEYDRLRINDTTDAGRVLLGTPTSLIFAQDLEYRATTAELRYASRWSGPLQLVVGGYFLDDKTRYASAVVNADGATGRAPCLSLAQCLAAGLVSADPTGLLPGDVVFAVGRRHKTEQKAVYAQAEYQFSERWTATVGARYFTADLRDDSTNDHDITNWFERVIVPGTTHELSPDTQSKASYNLSLTWEPNESLTTYARAASGFRIGGLNDAQDAAVNFGVVIPASYAPDSLWNYEVGLKAALFDRRLMLDGAVYYIDWSRQQLPASDPTLAVIYTMNAGKTEVKGIELTVRSMPFEGLSFDAGITYVVAELAADLPVEVMDGGNIGFEGDLVPNNPKWSGSLQTEYEFHAFGGWTAYVGGSLNYKGKSLDRFESDPVGQKIPSAAIVGLRMGLRSDRFSVGVIADNVFDKFVIYGTDQAAAGSGVPGYRFVGLPRTITLRLGAHF